MSRTKIESNIYYDDQKNLFYVHMDYGKDSTGKRQQVQKTFHTKKEARTALAKFKAERDHAVPPCNQTLKDYCTYWLTTEKRECSPTTLYGYANIINKHITPFMGNKALKDIDRTLVNQYLAQVGRTLSSNTVRKHYDLLTSVFLTAVQEEKLAKNPMTTIRPIRKVQTATAVYDAQQLKHLLDTAKGDRMEVVIALAGRLGLRRGEICGLRWEHVNLDNETLYIIETRTQAGNAYVTKAPKSESSIRTLKIPKELKEVLIKTKNGQEEDKKFFGADYQNKGYVMAWPDGKPYRPNYLSDLFTDFLKKHGFPLIRLHDLRHSFGTLAVGNADIYSVSRALGHSNTRITEDIYIHDDKKCKTVAVDAVSTILSA